MYPLSNSMAPVVGISVDWDYYIALLYCFIHFNKKNKDSFLCVLLFGDFMRVRDIDYDTNLIMPFLCMADLYAHEN